MVFSPLSTTNLEINELTHLDPFVYFQIRGTRGDKSPRTITPATLPSFTRWRDKATLCTPGHLKNYEILL